MAICLKILCFAIWMTIMMVLIHGSNQRKSVVSQEVCLSLAEEDESEKLKRKISGEIKLRPKLSLITAAAGYKQIG